MTTVEQTKYLPAEIGGERNPLLLQQYPDNWVHIAGRAILAFYMHTYHRLSIEFDPEISRTGPALFLTNHDSNLTTIALMVADPYYPPTVVPIKSGLFKVPIVSTVMHAWEAIPVNRDGNDIDAVRQMLRKLEQGRTVCLAAEGTRSRNGRLQPLTSSAVGFTLICARRGYPVIPIVELGTYAALPRGAWFPKPSQISVIVGKRIDLSRWNSVKTTPEVKTAAAQCIQDALAALLPLEQRPEPGSRPIS